MCRHLAHMASDHTAPATIRAIAAKSTRLRAPPRCTWPPSRAAKTASSPLRRPATALASQLTQPLALSTTCTLASPASHGHSAPGACNGSLTRRRLAPSRSACSLNTSRDHGSYHQLMRSVRGRQQTHARRGCGRRQRRLSLGAGPVPTRASLASGRLLRRLRRVAGRSRGFHERH